MAKKDRKKKEQQREAKKARKTDQKQEKDSKEIKQKQVSKEKKRTDVRYIVRIAESDLNGELPVYMSLTKIKGISQRFAEAVAKTFEKETGFPYNEELGKLKEEQDKMLENIILNPVKHGIPAWLANRRKDFDSGENKHLVSSELIFSKREDLKRLNEIKSYRGLRHSWGLTVRGQRTKGTHRGKGGVVGVMKKDAKQASSKKE